MKATGLTFKKHKLVKKEFLSGKIEYTHNGQSVSGKRYVALKKNILQARAAQA